jgi:hypothetical protein
MAKMKLRPEAAGFVEGVRWCFQNKEELLTISNAIAEARKRWPDFEPPPSPVKAPNLHSVKD